jgi:hypothetical protein
LKRQGPSQRGLSGGIDEIVVLHPDQKLFPYIVIQDDEGVVWTCRPADQYLLALCCDLDALAALAPLSFAPRGFAC